MRHIFLSTFLIWLNYRHQTWRILPRYLKALIYIAFINSSYYYFFKRHILWELQSNSLNLKQLRVVHIFFITPLIFLLCMAKFPEEDIRLQMKHILKWSFKCALVEFFGEKFNMIYFKNGWNIFWSWSIYIFLFSYGYLFTTKPKFVWKLSIPTLLFFLLKFKAPFRKALLLGPLLLVWKRAQTPKWFNVIKSYYTNCFSQYIFIMQRKKAPKV
ncbi:hypothetical protein LQ50_24815 [Halalkalibacter okhensis]|uniref:Uncharacterized protein n=1 Tax=Halalkalibacter okhensis TaxID=333138 RepID=A0A0B0I9E7_9BACI|nr:hypothetical protein LQ50_24815 [Halalkalibacter okhensis]